MTRNELVIAALAGGDVSSAAIAKATGLSERACRSRLRHLIAEGYAWSPERGRYRLTVRGRAIAAEVPSLATSHPPVAVPEVELEDRSGHGFLRRHRHRPESGESGVGGPVAVTRAGRSEPRSSLTRGAGRGRT
jgi:biotin operon repressor